MLVDLCVKINNRKELLLIYTRALSYKYARRYMKRQNKHRFSVVHSLKDYYSVFFLFNIRGIFPMTEAEAT